MILRLCAVWVVLGVLHATAWADSYTDYFRALTNNRSEVVASLLKRGFDPNTPNEQGTPGLTLAILSDAYKVAALLINHPQTQLETKDANGDTALMAAALKGQTELVDLLLNKGAEPNKPGWTPLHYAASGGHLETMKHLLEASAFIDATSENGTTPLMMAARFNQTAAARLLLEEGADPTLVNHSALTARRYAQKNKNQALFEELTKAERVYREKYLQPQDKSETAPSEPAIDVPAPAMPAKDGV